MDFPKREGQIHFKSDVVKADYSSIYREQVQDFITNKGRSELGFEQINSYQRKVLHDLAEEFALEHESIGLDKLKDFTLRKSKKVMQTQEEEKKSESAPDLGSKLEPPR